MDKNDKNSGSTPNIQLYQHFFNAITANCWIAPFVVIYWASTWNLVLSVLFFPDDIYSSIFVSAAVGFGIFFIFSSAQEYICRLAHAYGLVWSVVISRLYTYIMAFACVNQWRCVWEGWDVYTSDSFNNALVTLLGAYFIMVIFRCSSQVLAPPAIVALDAPLKTYFVCSTYAGTTPSTWQHVLDSLFSVTLVPFLVVTVWRGLWYVQDKKLSPDDATASGLYSLLIAFVLEGGLLLTRPWWMRLSLWTDGRCFLLKYLIEDVHTMLHNIVCISHWRGIWVLFDTHFLEPPLRYWVGHVIGYSMLTMTVSSNSILSRGCSRDGSKTKGEGINLDMHYYTHALRLWRQNDNTTKSNLESSSSSTPNQNSSESINDFNKCYQSVDSIKTFDTINSTKVISHL